MEWQTLLFTNNSDMKQVLVFHHIGIAVTDITKTASFYVSCGYRQSETIFDPIQNINICWLSKDNSPIIELLQSPNNEKPSPVDHVLQKNGGVTPYHICYQVEDIEASIHELRRHHFIILGKPVNAIAIKSSKVCFLFSKATGLIELVESPGEIII